MVSPADGVISRYGARHALYSRCSLRWCPGGLPSSCSRGSWVGRGRQAWFVPRVASRWAPPSTSSVSRSSDAQLVTILLQHVYQRLLQPRSSSSMKERGGHSRADEVTFSGPQRTSPPLSSLLPPWSINSLTRATGSTREYFHDKSCSTPDSSEPRRATCLQTTTLPPCPPADEPRPSPAPLPSSQ